MKSLIQHRLHQPPPRFVPPSKARLQPVTHRHQFINLGNNAVLFGEGWEGKLGNDLPINLAVPLEANVEGCKGFHRWPV